MSSRLTYLVKSVCGIRTSHHHDGRLLPTSLHGCTPVVIMHDRRLSAGIFEMRRNRKSSSPVYRLVAWKTYRLSTGTERATTVLHRDEIDPALALLARCGERLAVA